MGFPGKLKAFVCELFSFRFPRHPQTRYFFSPSSLPRRDPIPLFFMDDEEEEKYHVRKKRKL